MMPAAVVPLLAALLSVPAGGRYPPPTLSPRHLKERTLVALVGQLEGLAARRPVLIAWEDAHWSDPTSLELLDLIVDRARSLRALAVITFRPEFTPPWTRHAHVTTLTLTRLSRRQAAAMVDRLTGGEALPAPVLDQILAKTDGVPLFVEELTKSILESGSASSRGACGIVRAGDVARIADGAAGPARAGGQGGRPDRRGVWSGFLLPAVGGCRTEG